MNTDNFFSIIEFILRKISVFLLINTQRQSIIHDNVKYNIGNIICIIESVEINSIPAGSEKDIIAIISVIKKSVQNKFEIPKYLYEFFIPSRFSGSF